MTSSRTHSDLCGSAPTPADWCATHGYTNSLKGKSAIKTKVFVLLRSFFMIYHT